jgi:hypothetical protein
MATAMQFSMNFLNRHVGGSHFLSNMVTHVHKVLLTNKHSLICVLLFLRLVCVASLPLTHTTFGCALHLQKQGRTSYQWLKMTDHGATLFRHTWTLIENTHTHTHVQFAVLVHIAKAG